jgi:hypothetical protein
MAIGDLLSAINAWSAEVQRQIEELRWRLQREKELRARHGLV